MRMRESGAMAARWQASLLHTAVRLPDGVEDGDEETAMTARINFADLPPHLQRQFAASKPAAGKQAKYRSQWTEVDGIRFQSKREASRWSQLRLLQTAGKIALLRRQVPFRFYQEGKKVVTFWVDFQYLDLERGCCMVVEDSKSDATRKLQAYRIKVRLMAAHGITVNEV
jgi:hypothetical protein